MILIPYLSAAPNTQLHIILALASIVLGPFALYRHKRDRIHKIVGYIWVICMAGVALSSFKIHSFALIGPFSPIHGLAIFTLWSLYSAMRHVIAGRVAIHRTIMRNLYWYGLMLAGLANFLPGRRTNALFFGQNEQLGYGVIAFGVALMVVSAIVQKRRQKRLSPKQRIFPLEKPASMV